MGDLIAADGLPAEEVGQWAKKKHEYLCRYIAISSAARRKYVDQNKSPIGRAEGATYIDLFCGTGKAQVRETGEWIDGGCVAAWEQSKKSGAPFSQIYIADKDIERRNAALARLQKRGAPVSIIDGDAVEASYKLQQLLNKSALHFAFIDPYNLETLNFQIIQNLSALARMDMLIHYSQSDMQRNIGRNIGKEFSVFDSLAPGWREHIDQNQNLASIRRAMFKYWKDSVSKLDTNVSINTKLIKGGKNQPLYYLLLVASHKLPEKFWNTASNPEGQGSLF